MLVIPEVALGNRFITFMNWLKNQQQLDWIVINKCHIILNNQKDFQPKLKKLGKLNGVGMQMIILTATLLLMEEQKWMKKI